jgi:hypothetical protein
MVTKIRPDLWQYPNLLYCPWHDTSDDVDDQEFGGMTDSFESVYE